MSGDQARLKRRYSDPRLNEGDTDTSSDEDAGERALSASPSPKEKTSKSFPSAPPGLIVLFVVLFIAAIVFLASRVDDKDAHPFRS